MGRAGHNLFFKFSEFDPRGLNTPAVMLDFVAQNSGEMKERLWEFLVNETPIQTGQMQEKVEVWNFRASRAGISFECGWRAATFGLGYTHFYPKYVLEGTGIYGIHKTPIVPRKKKVLVWQDTEGTHFAPSVLGQPPQNILGKATDKFMEWLKNYFADCFYASTATMATRCKKGRYTSAQVSAMKKTTTWSGFLGGRRKH